ncbi:MAG: hypothetical protein LQ340_008006, partial [Diploschistes diacapsis]
MTRNCLQHHANPVEGSSSAIAASAIQSAHFAGEYSCSMESLTAGTNSIPTVTTPSKWTQSTEPFRVHTSLLFDSLSKSFSKNITLTISPQSGLVTHVESRPSASPSSLQSSNVTADIDLTSYSLVLPGLTDLHTHLFLHPYSEAPSTTQMLSESPVERVLRASMHARAALNAGWTTYRDLGTEGLGDADTHLRNAINRGLVPGPRVFCAGEAIASSGGYAIRSENDSTASLGAGYAGPLGPGTGNTLPPRISDAADGVPGVRAAVRRRLAAGADVVKVYADYRRRALRFPPPVANALGPGPWHSPDMPFPPATGQARSPNVPLWMQQELDALVDEARRAGATVAAHACGARAVAMAARAGVTSVEHGFEDEGDELGWNPFATPLAADAALREMRDG